MTCIKIFSHETRLGSASASHKSKRLRRILDFACLDARIIFSRQCLSIVCHLIFNSSLAKYSWCAAEQNHRNCLERRIVYQEYRIGWENSRDNANGVNHIVTFCIYAKIAVIWSLGRNTRCAIHSTFAEPRSSPTIGISLVHLWTKLISVYSQLIIFTLPTTQSRSEGTNLTTGRSYSLNQ